MSELEVLRTRAKTSRLVRMVPPVATIGAYRLVRKIGEGGMGAVYLGEHSLLARKAAIKVLRPSLSADRELVERFFHEARLVSMVSDPGIVQVYDFGYHVDGTAFLVMEFLDGEPMDSCLKRIRRFAVADCLRLAQQICAALDTAHGHGIVHRDLKPGNIFLVSGPGAAGGQRIKLLDFGIAKLSTGDPGQPRTRTGMLMGTPAYMSPEQCRGGEDVDHRSDIYAIACVMFRMLTGWPPFRSKLPGELIAAHLRQPPPRASVLLRDLPASVDDILQRCLQKSPADRFPSVASLGEAIAQARRAIDGSGDAARPSDLPGPVRCEPTRLTTSSVTVSCSELTTLHGLSGQFITPSEISGLPRRRRLVRAGLILGAAMLCSAGPIAVSHYRGADPVKPSGAGPLAPAPGASPPATPPGPPQHVVLPALAAGPLAITPSPTPERPAVAAHAAGDAVSANTTPTTPSPGPGSDSSRPPSLTGRSSNVPPPPALRRADRSSTGEGHAKRSRTETWHGPLDVPLGD